MSQHQEAVKRCDKERGNAQAEWGKCSYHNENSLRLNKLLADLSAFEHLTVMLLLK